MVPPLGIRHIHPVILPAPALRHPALQNFAPLDGTNPPRDEALSALDPGWARRKVADAAKGDAARCGGRAS
ncbi:hypothetical protein GCM10027167_75350 [Nocardia heshunensis]